MEMKVIRCVNCGNFNNLPTGDDCSECGKPLGIYAKLVRYYILCKEGADRKPCTQLKFIEFARALTPEEITELESYRKGFDAMDADPWCIYEKDDKLITLK